MKKIFVIFLFHFLFCPKIVLGDSLSDKITKISENFLGIPYELGPLGEEKGIDKDPLYREDKFDCLTFVETVLANTYNKTDLIKTMNKIRYKNSVVSFETRNHFQNPDWVNNNKEYIEDATSEISNKVLKKSPNQSIITLNRANWFKQNFDIDVNIQKEIVKLDYISLNDLKDNIEKFTNFITKPYIFMIVISDNTLQNKVGSDVDVSHTGFLIKKNGKLYIRHASVVAGKVVDNNFKNYIAKLQKNPKYKGFSLLKLKETKI